MDPGPEFGTHSVGWLPVEFELAREEFLGIRRAKRTCIWEHFYSETRPAFLRELSSLIGIDSNGSETVGFGLGSSVTEVLARLTASLSMMVSPGLSVVIPDNEFLTIQRAAAILGLSGASVTRVPWERVEEHVARPRAALDQDEKKDQEPMIQQLILVSLVNSCTQQIQQLDWVEDLPHDVVVVVDITQAIVNIPLACLNLGQLAARPNVFLVGSLIKHARCGENLGFMTFSRGSDRHIKEPASGWTAYLSGLVENNTTASNSNHLLYDEGLEWEGGTPSWVEATFVATRILKSMPPVEEQHAYVHKLKAAFVKRAGPMLSKVQLDSISDSNTLVSAPRLKGR
jgi:selenocysteine lyase/cysteine desulfurase